MKVAAVVALKADFPLRLLLAVANLAPSTFFYHQRRQDRADPQAALKTAIQDVFTEAHGRYGHRRVHAKLVRTGWRIAKKTVLRLMRELDLTCLVRRRRSSYRSYRGEVGTVAPNLLARDFTAPAPNQKWVTDITEFKTEAEKVYLSPVMDLYDRQIIAWSTATSPTVDFTNASLQTALATLAAEQTPLVHSDQGLHYQHASWHTLLTHAGAIPSMSRKATCLDNAMIENFFGHLKAELFHHATFANAAALIAALNEYIVWYNTERISLTLDGLSPVQYRAHHLAA